MRIRIDGLDQLQAKLKAAPGEAPNRLAGPLKLEGELIMTASKREVPVDTGILRASGIVRKPDIGSKKVVVELGYGGAATAYALVQHERTDFSHTVGNAKFLEGPVKAAKSGFGNRVASHLDLF